MIKIINLTYSNKGGAGSAVNRISELLSEFSISKIISFDGEENKNTVILKSTNNYFRALNFLRKSRHFYYKRLVKLYSDRYNYYNYFEKKNYTHTNKLVKKFPFKPDILIVHYNSHFINFQNIYEIQKATNCKVIFNLLDSSFLTGGCHYSWDCDGYTKSCQNCPAIKLKIHKNRSHINYVEKKKYLNRINCMVNVSSSYAKQLVEKSSLFKSFRTSLIYYPINFDINTSYNKPIKNKKRIIFFGTQNLSDKRKGVKYFIKAIEEFKKNVGETVFSSIIIVVAGKDKSIFPKNFNTNFIGYLNQEELVKQYLISDLFVCSSIEDNGPMMINEALSLGTPVVAFDTGISRDLINNKNGYIARNMDFSDLAKGIEECLINREFFKEKIIKDMSQIMSNKIILNQWKKLINDTIQ